MIELSLDMCNDMINIINSNDVDGTESMENQFLQNYNIKFECLQDIINKEIEKDYIENNIYHLVPFFTAVSLLFNGIIYIYLQKNTSI